MKLLWLTFLTAFCLAQTPPFATVSVDCMDMELEVIALDNVSEIIELDMSVPHIKGELRAISHDGSMIVTQTSERMYLWELCTGEQLFNIVQPGWGFVSSSEFSPHDDLLAIAGDGLHLIEIKTGDRRLLRDEYGLNDVAFSPDGQLIASARGQDYWCPDCENPPPNLNNNVLIQRVDTGEVVAEIWREETDEWGFSGVAFSPDGTLLVTVGSGQSLFLWNVDDLLDQVYTPVGVGSIEQQGGDVAFSPDGVYLAVSYELLQTGGDGYAMLPLIVHASIYSVESLLGNASIADAPSYVAELVDWAGAWGITYTSDGTMIAIYGAGALPSLWNAQTGEKLVQFMHDDSLVLSPDERLVITSNAEKGLRFWGVPSS